jgi:hypothetical protein
MKDLIIASPSRSGHHFFIENIVSWFPDIDKKGIKNILI